MMSNTRNTRKGKNTDISQAILHALQRIQVNTALEVDRMVPRTPDPEKILIKRNKTYSFNQIYSIADLSGNTAAPVGGVITPNFQSISDYSSFSAIFDSYRINQITVSFTPVQQAATAGGTAPGAIYTAFDYDDAAVPTTVNDLLSYDSLLIVPSGTYFERTFYPKVATALYGGSAFSSYGVQGRAWIDCASPTVPHYGLKYLINTSTQNARQWTVVITVNISFRNTH